MTDTTTTAPADTAALQAEADEEFLAKLEEQAVIDADNKLRAQVPPRLQMKFMEAHPMPKMKVYGPQDDEEARQVKSKRGDPAPNEPEYEIVPNPLNPSSAVPGGGGGQAGASATNAPYVNPVVNPNPVA